MTDYYTQIKPSWRRQAAIERDEQMYTGLEYHGKQRTGFDPYGADGKGETLANKKQWHRLCRRNRGDGTQRHSDLLREIDTIATTLEITPHQRARCKDIIDSIGSTRSVGACDWRVVIVATITIVVNRDNRHIQRESCYSELMGAMPISRSSVHSVRDTLRTSL